MKLFTLVAVGGLLFAPGCAGDTSEADGDGLGETDNTGDADSEDADNDGLSDAEEADLGTELDE